MNFYVVSSGVNVIACLVIALIIFTRHNRRPLQTVYGCFVILVALWATAFFFWALEPNPIRSLQILILLEYPVCFIHTAFFHFTLLFCGVFKKYKKLLTTSYLISIAFCLINATGGLFILPSTRTVTPFVACPYASILLDFLILTEVAVVVFSFYIMYRSIKIIENPLRARNMAFLVSGIIGWSGGITNWFYFFDNVPIPPYGNPLVAAYMISTAYLTIKHDILGMNLVIKKTFTYTALTILISFTYAIFVTLSEYAFRSYMGYSSIVGTFGAAVMISIFFTPARNAISAFVDKSFFGRSIEDLSRENNIMKAELQKQDRLKAVAVLAAGMAHEIKNPLTSIKTFSEYLPKKYDDPDFRAKFSKLVVDEVDRVSSIVQQLLDFAKPAEPELKASNISDVLDETLALLTSNLLKARVELSKCVDSTLIVMADKNQLKQALLNLFLNSIQSMPIGGVLTITAKSLRTKAIVISITDTGAGINKEHLPHIFDPFYTTKEGGTGLGLAIVHSIITKHGGKIDVQSTVGVGTTVTITLKRNIM